MVLSRPDIGPRTYGADPSGPDLRLRQLRAGQSAPPGAGRPPECAVSGADRSDPGNPGGAGEGRQVGWRAEIGLYQARSPRSFLQNHAFRRNHPRIGRYSRHRPRHRSGSQGPGGCRHPRRATSRLRRRLRRPGGPEAPRRTRRSPQTGRNRQKGRLRGRNAPHRHPNLAFGPRHGAGTGWRQCWRLRPGQ